MLKRLKKYKILFGLIVLVIAFGLYNRQAFPAIYSIISSYFQPIDIEYIKEQGEWLGTTGGIVRFDDNSETISGDTIYRDNEPIMIVKRLNKNFNEMYIYRLDRKTYDTYTSTIEFTK
jgi:hypothetical protein